MIDQYIISLAKYIRTHMQEVCFGITAVTLVIAGPSINGLFRKITQNLHWFFRYLLFIVLCSAGYGALSQVIYRGVRNWLRGQSSIMLVIWTAAIYLLLAWIAKKQKDI
jgi:ABC-type multidrug transport system permease subunit